MGLNITEQLAVVPLLERVQAVDEKLPGRLLENVAVPPGAIGVPGLVSVTVTVHVVGLKTSKGGAHDRVVETLRVPTVSRKLEALPEWLLSPR